MPRPPKTPTKDKPNHGCPDPEPEAVEHDLTRIRTPHAIEREDQHAALLLYAAQPPEARSWSGIERATGLAIKTIKYWHDQWSWETRIRWHGETVGAERDAAVMYRELYLGTTGRAPVEFLRDRFRPVVWAILSTGGEQPSGTFATLRGDGRRLQSSVAKERERVKAGASELPASPDAPAAEWVVESGASPGGAVGGGNGVPGSAPGSAEGSGVGSIAATAGDSLSMRTARATEAAARAREVIREKARLEAEAHEREQRAHMERVREQQEQQEQERKRIDAFYRNTQRIIEAAVSSIARQLTAKDADGNPVAVPVRLADLPKLVEQHRELAEVLGTVAPVMTGGGGTLEPSYRVQLASSTGGDVLQAMRDDVRELDTILGMLIDRRVGSGASGTVVDNATGAVIDTDDRPADPVMVLVSDEDQDGVESPIESQSEGR